MSKIRLGRRLAVTNNFSDGNFSSGRDSRRSPLWNDKDVEWTKTCTQVFLKPSGFSTSSTGNLGFPTPSYPTPSQTKRTDEPFFLFVDVGGLAIPSNFPDGKLSPGRDSLSSPSHLRSKLSLRSVLQVPTKSLPGFSLPE